MIESLFKYNWNCDTWKFNRMIDWDREWQNKKEWGQLNQVSVWTLNSFESSADELTVVVA